MKVKMLICLIHEKRLQRLRRDQRSDRSLIHCWSLADRHKAGYYARDGVLYRNYKYLGQDYEQLMLPVNRRSEVMKLAHEIYVGHLGAKKTKGRIKLSFTWPTIASDVQKTCESTQSRKCHQCHKKRRVAVYGRVPVMPIPQGDVPLDSSQIDEATCDTVTTGHKSTKINHYAVICDDDRNYGSVDVKDTDQFQKSELVPSQRVDLTTLSHLSVEQRTKLLALLDQYSECYWKTRIFLS